LLVAVQLVKVLAATLVVMETMVLVALAQRVAEQAVTTAAAEQVQQIIGECL
jgi:hypothetical protein